jgi:hypothetical protein
MADFRIRLLAFALVALFLGAGIANAQAFTCTANAGTPVIVRVEGITELVGDLLLQCVGGQPTPKGQPVNVTNLRLTLNTNITSKLLSSINGAQFTEALLLIDEPYPNDSNTPQNTHPGPGDANSGIVGNVTVPPNSPFQNLCVTSTNPIPGACNYLLGNFLGGVGAASTASGTPGSPYLNANQTSQGNVVPATVYEARQVAANAVEWDGVPIDAPGSTGVRIIRLTNVRANACQLGLSSTLIPTQIVGFVSITGSPFFTINNPQQTLAFIQQGLNVAGINSALAQCVNLNTGGGGVGGNISGGGNTIIAVSNVNVQEGFAQSFKKQQFSPDAAISGTGSIGPFSSTSSFQFAFYNIAPQNVPGYSYNTESGFEPTAANGSTQLDGRIGSASFGTRILLRFSNVGNGANVILPGVVPLTTNNGGGQGFPIPPSAVGGWTGGYLVLLGTSDLNGNAGAFSNQFTQVNNFVNSAAFFASGPFKGLGAVAPFNTAFSLTPVAGTAAAVYEVVNSDPSAVEQANIPVGVSFVSNTPNNLPTPGQATVNASFAPISTVNTASSGDPIPRFCDRSVARNTFNIQICQCNLLFPFVTQAPGFDTGIAIANTSQDPFGTQVQDGTVTLNFFGQVTGGGALPPTLAIQTTTGNVPHGQVMTWTTFGGAGSFAAGLQPTPGFTGYMIAVAKFQYCHGFAFISDLGAQKLAEGYLAIQLDVPNWAATIPGACVGCNGQRTNVSGESQGH